MSEQDLAIATKKEKAIPASYLGSRTYFGKNLFRMLSFIIHFVEVEGGRVKRKELDMKSKITDHDFEFQVAKIIKWLQKENFVAVKIKTTRDTTSQDAERLKEKILKEVQNNEDILGDRMSRLTIVC